MVICGFPKGLDDMYKKIDIKIYYQYIAFMQIRILKYITILFCVIGFNTGYAQAQSLNDVVGFVDQNRDGINDLFSDVNGDGINDKTGKSYQHSFEFEDKNGDGINDLWVDSDGDGVNDRLGEVLKKMSQWIDRDGDGILDEEVGQLRGKGLKLHVLDVNGDGCNDVTGNRYTGRDLYGYRYGNVDEEMDLKDPDFLDKDGDGMNDRFKERSLTRQQDRERMDRFIDADGDGIADDRGLERMRRNGGKKGKK